ncbi:trihelix transcription factor ASIL2-like [Panicum miliaceum]|uniref:Trihelix transcription factor ASIL2-like n=1 Tax=Panicum miliaceum TaxID=4540 RepID=A0A3L6RBB5_PANMI|nr:trihelix transcription factor ASIL2-like [Panicum miliaceum]
MEVREMAMAAAAAAAVGGGGGKLPPPNPNLPYREDCWSDGETAALVSAWGSRYVELNRGNLRQKQWQEVADAVNSRRGASARRRPPRTDVQCKNRVDTLKKKYKAERARNAPSGWSFFHELDRLVGPTLSASASKRPSPSQAPQFALPFHPPALRNHQSPSPSPPPPMALPLPDYHRGSPLPAAALIQKAAAAAAAAVSDLEDSDDDGGINNHNSQRSPSHSVSSLSGNGNNKKRSRDEAGSGGDKGFKELARAIEAFSEMYERVENAKQKHELEMERQRIEFLKQLEVKRMENFVDAHVKLARAKRPKKTTGGAADGAGAMELVATVASMPFVSTSTFL